MTDSGVLKGASSSATLSNEDPPADSMESVNGEYPVSPRIRPGVDMILNLDNEERYHHLDPMDHGYPDL
jgi:hypothetical protein